MSSDPVSANLTLVRGDDYYNADGRAIAFVDSSLNWPDLTGASVQLTLTPTGGGTAVTVSGTISSPTTNKAVRFDLSAATTGGLVIGAGAYRYDVQAALTSTHKVTLARGSVTVFADYTP